MKTFVVILMSAGIGAGGTWFVQSRRADGLNYSASPTIEQVQKLAALVVLKVPVADVKMYQLYGSTGSIRAVLVSGAMSKSPRTCRLLGL